MPEGLQKNESNEGNEFSKGVESIVSSFVLEIDRLKNKSIKPKIYDSLIDEVKSEGSFVILRQKDILQAHKKDINNLLPETEKKMNIFFKKFDDVLKKYEELNKFMFNIKPLDIFQKGSLRFKESIKKIEDLEVGRKNPDLKDLIKEMEKNYHESMMRLYEETERKSDGIALFYRDFLKNTAKDITLQLKNIPKDNKIETILTSKTHLDINQLLDNFITNCKEKFNKAISFYIQEQAELN